MSDFDAQNLIYQRIYTYFVIFRPLNQGQSLQTKLGTVVKYDWKVLTNFQNEFIQGSKSKDIFEKHVKNNQISSNYATFTNNFAPKAAHHQIRHIGDSRAL